MRNLRLLLLLCCLLGSAYSRAQCPAAAFDIVQDSVCLQESLSISHVAQSDVDYAWDFCPGDMAETGSASNGYTISSFSTISNIRLADADNITYAISTSRGSNKIAILSLSDSLDQSIEAADVATYSPANLNGPEGAYLYHEDGLWYALVTNFNNGNLVRLSFTSGLDNDPVSEVVNLPAGITLSQASGLEILHDADSGAVAFITSRGNNRIVRLHFADGIDQDPSSGDNITVSGLALPRAIRFYRECDEWTAILLGLTGDELFRLHFGDDLSSSPSTVQLSLTGSLSIARDLCLVRDGLEYYALVASSNSGALYRVSLGDSLATTTAGTVENLGNYSLLGSSLGFDVLQEGSHFTGLWVDTNIKQVRFENACAATSPAADSSDPGVVAYSTAGTYPVALRLTDSLNRSYTVIDTVIAKNVAGPEFSFDTGSNRCLDSVVTFSASDISGDITDWLWDFGDASGSTLQNPEHTYGSAGSYTVSLTTSNSDGCSNTLSSTLPIYTAPAAAFSVSDPSLCTNTALSFVNNSTGGADSVLSWLWIFDATDSSTVENPQYTFSDSGEKVVFLRASIPGCESEMSDTLTLQGGPLPAFSFMQACAGDTVFFVNESVGALTAAAWDFGDGGSSSALSDTSYAYAATGSYTVSLAVTDTGGCTTTTSLPLEIAPSPYTDINLSTDEELRSITLNSSDNSGASDSITSYLWLIDGDTVSTSDAFAYTFPAAGDYALSLIVGTAQGCESQQDSLLSIRALDCPEAAMSLPDSLCQGEPGIASDLSLKASSYYWDFCAEDLLEPGAASDLLSLTGFGSPSDVQLVQADTGHVLLMSNRNTNEIGLVFLGDSLSQPLSDSDLLTYTFGDFNGPEGIAAYKEGSNWHALVSNFSSGDLVRLDFGSSLRNAPTATALTLPGGISLSQASGISIAPSTDSTTVAFIANRGGNNLVRLFFNAGLGSEPSAGENISVTGASLPRSIELVRSCADWYGYLLELGNNEIYRLSLGQDPAGTATIEELALKGDALAVARGLAITEEGGSFTAFVASSSSGNLYRLSLGTDLSSNDSILSENLGNYGLLSNSLGFAIAPNRGSYTGFWIDAELRQVTFSRDCGTLDAFSTEANPVFGGYTQAGTMPVALQVWDSNGFSSGALDSLVIKGDSVANVSIDLGTARCAGSSISFTATDPEGIVTGWNWDFGDGNGSTTQNPAHTYAASGDYLISLSTSTAAGCSNSISDSLSIYDAPVASFALPTGNLCSNSTITLSNTSTGGDSTLNTYEWIIDSNDTLSTEDLSYTFASAGEHIVQLTVSIPGCSSTFTDTLTFLAGPVLSLAYAQACLNDSTAFVLSSDKPLDSLLWVFGDGDTLRNSSLSVNHLYDSAATFALSVTVTDTAGCVSTLSDSLTIDPVPYASLSLSSLDELIDITLTASDLTHAGDSVTDVAWSVDGSSIGTGEQVSYAFPAAGDYLLSLSATTARGCIASLDSTVSIASLTCPVAGFSLPDSVCLDQELYPSNGSFASTRYEWDFCAEDLDAAPAVNTVAAPTGFSNISDIDYQYRSDSSFIAFSSRGNNRIALVAVSGTADAYPGSLPLVIVNSVLFDGPEAIALHYDSGNWYGLVGNFNNASLLFLDFGNSLLNTPAVSTVTLPSGLSLSAPSGIEIVADAGIHAFVSNRNSNQLVRLDFGESLSDSPASGASYSVAGISGLRRTALLRHCDGWAGIALGINDNSFSLLSISDSLDATLNSTALSTSGDALQSIRDIQLLYEPDGYRLFLNSSASGSIYSANLGTDLSAVSDIAMTNRGDYGLLSGSLSFALRYTTGRYSGAWADTEIKSLRFEALCGASLASSTTDNPNLNYSLSGTHKVRLIAYDVAGNVSGFMDSLVVTGDQADIPVIDPGEVICVEGTLSISDASGGAISAWTWDFGDGNTGSGQSTSHQYASTGDYTIGLSVVSTNGCENSTSETITIYPAPVADFTVPAGPLCSFAPLAFGNTTTGPPDSLLSWQWTLGDLGISTDQSPEVTFSNSGTQNIQLIASLPGCADTTSQDINILAGPVTDFTADRFCFGQATTFTNLTTGSGITGYAWDFGNSLSSTNTDASVAYNAPGDYLVSLSASNDLGCTTTDSLLITINSLPDVGFTASLACDGQITSFTDTSFVDNANISAWSWDFGDGGSSTLQNPEYTFSNTGLIEVSLSATSSFGCVASGSSFVEVLESPVPAYDAANFCAADETVFASLSTAYTGINSTTWEIDGSPFEGDSVTTVLPGAGDYVVSLFVEAGNFCTASLSDTITIHPLPEISLTVSTACDNAATTFTDLSTISSGSIASRYWGLGAFGFSRDSVVSFPFPSAGQYPYSLSVSSDQGCSASVDEELTVNISPTASFAVQTLAAAAPFAAEFSNTSLNADSFLWSFGDAGNSTAFAEDTSFTYDETGTYEVILYASNSSGCSDSTVRTLSALLPAPDLAITQVNVLDEQGQQEVVLTLSNAGNVIHQQARLSILVNNAIGFEDAIDLELLPGESYNASLDLSFTTALLSNIRSVCITISDSTSGEDINPVDNTTCLTFEGRREVLPPYPNPVTDLVTLPVILPAAEQTEYFLYDSFGKLVADSSLPMQRGLNLLRIPTDALEPGVYLIRVITGEGISTFRIIK